MGQDFSKYLINFIIILLAFFLVETEPMMSIILLGVAAFLLFFLYSRHAIIIYALYFALEETILLHIPAQFIVIMKYLGDILILSIFLATFAKLAMRRYVLSSFQTGPMHIPLFLFLTGALAISSTLGLIAIFAPSGLGVREGALVYLLSFVMAAPVAVLISILTRIWMTLIEIGLIGVVYLIDRFPNRSERRS